MIDGGCPRSGTTSHRSSAQVNIPGWSTNLTRVAAGMGDKQRVLQELTLGSRIAEEEAGRAGVVFR
ncbi:hypothetical protein [Micromonospora sp. DPT]|uniref:hypothetical protein n=1 Tax=Micromonospora sp. DPT TaxID=3142975 RepID=UPI00320B5FD5